MVTLPVDEFNNIIKSVLRYETSGRVSSWIIESSIEDVGNNRPSQSRPPISPLILPVRTPKLGTYPVNQGVNPFWEHVSLVDVEIGKIEHQRVVPNIFTVQYPDIYCITLSSNDGLFI